MKSKEEDGGGREENEDGRDRRGWKRMEEDGRDGRGW